MKILYGVVGEGMGHATRSRVVLEHLCDAGHDLRVVVSGNAHGFLTDRFAERQNIRFQEIHGLSMAFDGNALDKSATLRQNLERLPRGLLRNVAAYRSIAEDGFRPDVVISDFESWAYLYGLNHRLPVISVDNMQVLNRCTHGPDVTADKSFSFRLAKATVKGKLPGAYHYLVSSFFFPPVRKRRTTLVPPILRPEVLTAERVPGDHLLVYTKGSNADVVRELASLGVELRVYGLTLDDPPDNVTLRPFSETGFVDDLRTARGVVASAGYSLMGEAVHLGVPMLAVPLTGQYEQALNARYLRKLGYGDWAPEIDGATVRHFLERTDDYAAALSGTYTPRDNTMLLGCVDELLGRVASGAPPPVVLDSPSMGGFEV